MLSTEKIVEFRSLLNKAVTVFAEDMGVAEGVIPKLNTEQYKVVAGVLGQIGKAREVEAYVRVELERCKDHEEKKQFLNNLLGIVSYEIYLLEFFPTKDELQTEIPLPKEIKVLNLDQPDSNQTIETEDLLANFEKMREESVFKR